VNFLVPLSFFGLCFAWTFSWFAIKLQTASGVRVEYSVAYRFFIASIIVFIIAKFAKQRIKISIPELLLLIIIGICNCGVNFILIYIASEHVVSGVIAMLSPISIIACEILISIYERRVPSPKTIVSALVGILGIYVFVYDIIHLGSGYGSKAGFGILLVLVEVLIFAIGCILLSILKKKYCTPLYSSIGYSAMFGSCISICIGLSMHSGAFFDLSMRYTLGLLYSTFISSVLGFICFYYLIEKIGSVKANYTSLIYPITAMVVSSYCEGYSCSMSSIIGVFFILFALVIEFVHWGALLSPKRQVLT